MSTGKVYLIGAGPGDPGLITVKGAACLQKADVVIYDFLASRKLLTHARKDAEIIYVGKRGGAHTCSQAQINELIVEKAKAGLTVARLKGGDPFIFGRGGEEAEVLVADDILFEIVPGVTAAVGVAAYAGIPITHRRYTATVAFITGHEDPTKENSDVDWEKISTGIGTLLFFMGVKNIDRITEKLITNGRSPDTPVAVVRWGTTGKQTTVTGTLSNIVRRVKEAEFKPPAIIIVGEVVRLRSILNWFEKKPLFGKTVLVTRARQQASNLVDRLEEMGAECLEAPTIEVVPPENWDSLDKGINNLSTYDWLVFSSVNGVRFFFERLYANGKDVRALRDIKLCTVGSSTAKQLEEFGLRTDMVPDTYKAESIVEEFKKEDMKGKGVLLPRPKVARPVLPVELKKMGAIVDEVIAYCTVPVCPNLDELKDHLKDKKIDLVTFTSSSTVKNFKKLFTEEEIRTLLTDVTIAAIGPITADTAKELGFKVAITPEEYTIAGLCNAIERYYNKEVSFGE
ncbi:MAG: uroporphyrinogen-III C-methyltransferase [Pseudomonadota bacterium]